jgi:hypothetical protein
MTAGQKMDKRRIKPVPKAEVLEQPQILVQSEKGQIAFYFISVILECFVPYLILFQSCFKMPNFSGQTLPAKHV